MDTTLMPTQIHNLKGKQLAKFPSLDKTTSFEKNGVFQHIVGLASLIFKVPVALINFVDETDFRIQASVGLDGLKKVSRAVALCSYAIDRDFITVFEDTKDEQCIHNHPMVNGPAEFKFYAAVPLITKDGYNYGLIAIGDVNPRKFDSENRQILESLAALVMEEFDSKIMKAVTA